MYISVHKAYISVHGPTAVYRVNTDLSLLLFKSVILIFEFTSDFLDALLYILETDILVLCKIHFLEIIHIFIWKSPYLKLSTFQNIHICKYPFLKISTFKNIHFRKYPHLKISTRRKNYSLESEIYFDSRSARCNSKHL